MLLLGTLLLIQALIRSPRLYRRQAGALLISVLAPWVGNALYVSGLSPFLHLDLTPFAFTLTGLMGTWGLFRFRLLDIVPVARDAVIEGMSDGVIVLDVQNRIVDLNPAAQRIIGRSAAEAIGQPAAQLLSDRPDLVERYRDVTGAHAEIVLGEGEAQRCFDLRISPLYGRRGHLTGRLVVLRDITERKRTEEALRDSEERYRDLFENASDLIQSVALDGHLVYVNRAWRETLGYDEEEIASLSLFDIIHPDSQAHCMEVFQRVMSGEEVDKVEAVFVSKDGKEIAVEGTANCKFVDGKPVYTRGIFRDITARRRAEETIKRLAYHDALTGLPNRRLFNDRLNLALAHAHRSQQKLAVMLFDLDHFKDVNDTLGHSVGDLLLQVVGDRLTSLLRKGDTVARMGGDEFMLLLPETAQEEDAAKIAQKILEAFRKPFVFDGHELRITTSIGIAMYPEDGEDGDTLMKNADIAMYRAKDKGRDNYQRYTPVENAARLRSVRRNG